MNPGNYKTKRQGQPMKNNSNARAKKRRALKEWTPAATPKLREIYATKTEWATKIMPKVKE